MNREGSERKRRGPGSDCPAETKKAILAAIAEHLRDHGPQDWRLVRQVPEFDKVIGPNSGGAGERLFWSWVAKVKRDLPADRTRPHDGREIAEEHGEWAAEQVRLVAEKLLQPPPKSFFAKRGADGVIRVDLLSTALDIAADHERVRKQCIAALGSEPSARKELTESAKARTDMLAKLVPLFKEVYGIDELHRRYEAIMHAIVTVLADLPERQRQVLNEMEKILIGEPTVSSHGELR